MSWAELLSAEGAQVLGGRARVHGGSGKVRSPAPLPAGGSSSVRPRVHRDGHVSPVFGLATARSCGSRPPLSVSPPLWLGLLGGHQTPWVSPFIPPLSPGLAQASGPCPPLSRVITGLALGPERYLLLQAGVAAGSVPSWDHKSGHQHPSEPAVRLAGPGMEGQPGNAGCVVQATGPEPYRVPWGAERRLGAREGVPGPRGPTCGMWGDTISGHLGSHQVCASGSSGVAVLGVSWCVETQ